MYHQTLQKLSHMTDHVEFERMMSDLLSSIGYKGIDPQSPGLPDNGKDALYYDKASIILFAFSLRKDWKEKFQDDFQKATASGTQFQKFVFCTNQNIPTLEKDKLRQVKAVEIDFFDAERLRVLLDTHCKKIREVYLGIQDNTTIRKKIRNTLFDPQNEVAMPERWRMLGLVADLDMAGLFALIKDADLTMICETPDELDSFTAFIDVFMKLRKLATEVDNCIDTAILAVFPTNMPSWMQKISEYCKMRVIGEDKRIAEQRVYTGYIAHSNEDIQRCEQVYEAVQQNQELRRLMDLLRLIFPAYRQARASILALKGFHIDN